MPIEIDLDLAPGAIFATAPLVYTPATRTMSIPQATAAVDGYLAAVDFASFNNRVRIPGDTMTGPLIITPAIDSAALLRINNAAGVGVFDVDSTNRRVYINATAAYGRNSQPLEVNISADEGGAALNTWSAIAAEAAMLDFNRSKSAIIGTHAVVASGDALGFITFRGSDAAAGEFIEAAQIRAEVDGAPGDNDMPGRLVFLTTPDGAASVTERMRIDSTGRLRLVNFTIFPSADGVNAINLRAANGTTPVMTVDTATAGGPYITIGPDTGNMNLATCRVQAPGAAPPFAALPFLVSYDNVVYLLQVDVNGHTIVDNNLGIGTGTVSSPTNSLSLGGNAARTFWMERHTTADTPGNNLTVQAGGATVGATNRAGGELSLLPGQSTGSAESGVAIYGCVAGAPGVGDNAIQRMVDVLGNKLGFFATPPVVQQASGANLTNNVTVGGVNDTIADFVDLAVYANDAATIRNDIYQLARKAKQVNDALRLYGLLT